jgi:hypothetical protein
VSLQNASNMQLVTCNLSVAKLSRILKSMEVHFNPETEKKLRDLAVQNGRARADELVQDIVEGYFDELANVRDTWPSAQTPRPHRSAGTPPRHLAHPLPLPK